MKKLLFTVLIFIGLNVSAQAIPTDSIQGVKITETERIIDKYSSKVENALIVLAEKLEVPITKLWEIMIKQQYVFAITHTIIIILTLILCIWLWWKNTIDSYGGSWREIPIILSIIGIIYFCIVITSVIGCYINPEYYVIKEIHRLITS